ncbi:glycosyltransferase, partial [Citrobacter freundii]|nr:glycosyltransferase [Citrobacter freundii]
EQFKSQENIEFYEYKNIKTGWLKRLKFEYITSFTLSKELNPDAWICLHDMSARVATANQFVYCHNPSPFYQASHLDLKYDRTFFLFTKLYKYLYRVNIKSNKLVIVQQQWIAKYFKENYSINNLLVARPEAENIRNRETAQCNSVSTGVKRLLYPAFPRTFKNFNILLDAMAILKKQQIHIYNKLNIILTFNKGMTKFGDFIIFECERRGLQNIHFIGLKSKEKLDDIYRNETDALIFPSKLETWGLPLSEAKEFKLPILSADLPYAHETIGNYERVNFFKPDDAVLLAEKLAAFSQGEDIFGPTTFTDDPAYLVSHSWAELAKQIIDSLEMK